MWLRVSLLRFKMQMCVVCDVSCDVVCDCMMSMLCLRWCMWIEDVRASLFATHCVKLYGMRLCCAWMLNCTCVRCFRVYECVGVVCDLLWCCRVCVFCVLFVLVCVCWRCVCWF